MTLIGKSRESELEMVESVLNESYQELIQAMRNDSKKYLDFLIRIVRNTSNVIEDDTIGISLSKEDEKLFEAIQKEIKKNLKLLPPSKIAGGVISIAGKTYIDNSIDNIFSKMRPLFIKIIAEALEE